MPLLLVIAVLLIVLTNSEGRVLNAAHIPVTEIECAYRGTIDVSAREFPIATIQLRRAFRQGYPEVWHIERTHAQRRHREHMRQLPARSDFARNAIPPANVREGKRSTVRYLSSVENKRLGELFAERLRGCPDGTRVHVRLGP